MPDLSPGFGKACRAVGVGVPDSKQRTYKSGRIHDQRVRAAIMSDAGVVEDLIMKTGGWKTKAMFSRYNVVNAERIRKAMEQLARVSLNGLQQRSKRWPDSVIG